MIIEKQTHAEFRIGANAALGTSVVRLTDDDARVYMHVLVQAAGDNTGTVYVGHDSNVSSSNGWALAAGESVEIPVDDASKVWVIASEAAQTVKWLAV